MPPIPVVAGTIVRIGLNTNLGNGRHSTNLVDVSVDEGIAGDRETAVINTALAVGQAWQDDIAMTMPNAVNYTGGQYIDLDSLTGVSGTFGFVPGHPVNSGTTSSTLSPQVAILIHKHCAHSRSQRAGRMFLPAAQESAVDDAGRVQSAFATFMQTKLDAFATKINGSLISGADTAWRVVHVTGHTGVPEPGFPLGRPNAWDSSDVTSTSIDGVVGTQRRRNRG